MYRQYASLIYMNITLDRNHTGIRSAFQKLEAHINNTE